MQMLEKDILILSAIRTLAVQSGVDITDKIPNFNKEKIKELTLQTFPNNQRADEKLIELARESYLRLEKKFNKK